MQLSPPSPVCRTNSIFCQFKANNNLFIPLPERHGGSILLKCRGPEFLGPGTRTRCFEPVCHDTCENQINSCPRNNPERFRLLSPARFVIPGQNYNGLWAWDFNNSGYPHQQGLATHRECCANIVGDDHDRVRPSMTPSGPCSRRKMNKCRCDGIVVSEIFVCKLLAIQSSAVVRFTSEEVCRQLWP